MLGRRVLFGHRCVDVVKMPRRNTSGLRWPRLWSDLTSDVCNQGPWPRKSTAFTPVIREPPGIDLDWGLSPCFRRKRRWVWCEWIQWWQKGVSSSWLEDMWTLEDGNFGTFNTTIGHMRDPLLKTWKCAAPQCTQFHCNLDLIYLWGAGGTARRRS